MEGEVCALHGRGQQAKPLKLRGIYLDYGQKEEFTHIQLGARQFSSALAERGIPHIFEIYEGADHSSKIRREETRVFAFFSEKRISVSSER